MTETEINTAIAARARAGEALTEAELAELDAVDVLSLGMLADEVRRTRIGTTVTYARVLEVPPSGPVDAAAVGRASELRLQEAGESLESIAARIRELRGLVGTGKVLTGFSLADLRDGQMGALDEVLVALRQAGLDAIAEAPVDLVAASDLDAVFGAGLGLGTLSVQQATGADRVSCLLRARACRTGRPGVRAFAPLPREQSAAPTTGYHDVRLVALSRLALPDIPIIQVDWRQYGPKLAQVALTFGASHLDRVSTDDDQTLGRRRTPVEDVRRNVVAAGFTPAEASLVP